MSGHREDLGPYIAWTHRVRRMLQQGVLPRPVAQTARELAEQLMTWETGRGQFSIQAASRALGGLNKNTVTAHLRILHDTSVLIRASGGGGKGTDGQPVSACYRLPYELNDRLAVAADAPIPNARGNGKRGDDSPSRSGKSNDSPNRSGKLKRSGESATTAAPTNLPTNLPGWSGTDHISQTTNKDASLREGSQPLAATSPSQAAIYDVWWGDDGYLEQLVNAEERALQWEVAERFESILHSKATRPLGLLRRALRDAYYSSLPMPVALREALRALAKKHDGPHCSWRWCDKCDEHETPTPSSACRCPERAESPELLESSAIWAEVEGIFGGVAADVLDDLAETVKAVLQSEAEDPAAIIRANLPPPAIRANIRRKAREEEAARRLTAELRKAAPGGWTVDATVVSDVEEARQ